MTSASRCGSSAARRRRSRDTGARSPSASARSSWVTPRSAASYDLIGEALLQAAEVDEAVAAHRRALTVREATRGAAHRLTGKTHRRLADALLASGAPVDAIAHGERALAIASADEPDERARALLVLRRARLERGETRRGGAAPARGARNRRRRERVRREDRGRHPLPARAHARARAGAETRAPAPTSSRARPCAPTRRSPPGRPASARRSRSGCSDIPRSAAARERWGAAARGLVRPRARARCSHDARGLGARRGGSARRERAA
ncbi:MAG: tetratricopeptide repeat protein [Myxococcales bacterium]|nr:tetratricopeptide repeat protein [Myxococcales bacterium]